MHPPWIVLAKANIPKCKVSGNKNDIALAKIEQTTWTGFLPYLKNIKYFSTTLVFKNTRVIYISAKTPEGNAKNACPIAI